MENGFYSVRILRTRNQEVYSVWLQEFFKFSGVYVEEWVVDGINDFDSSIFSTVDLNLVLTIMEG